MALSSVRPSVRPSVCPSVCGSVHKACKHDTDCQLGLSNMVHILLVTRGRTLLIFKVTRYTLLLNLVNRIQTEPSQLGPSNLVHILLMTRETNRIDFQGHGSKVKVRCFTLLLNDTD